MRDFEKLMVAIYDMTIDVSKPFVDEAAAWAAAGVPRSSDVVLLVQRRGFLDICADGTLALSEAGITYVETRLRRG